MHAVMTEHVARKSVPGLVLAIARRGDVHVFATGDSAFSEGAPIDDASIFRLSSMSKPVVAVAALLLIEECAIRLDDPVEQWLPELANRRVVRDVTGPIDDTVAAHRSITVRDLLTFRMGFGADDRPSPLAERAQEFRVYPGLPAPQAPPEPNEWMRRLGSLPLFCQPGERWLYHTGADTLGVLIARVCGDPLDVFLRERIFEPLGMADTGFFVPPQDHSRLVTSYVTNNATGELDSYDAPSGQWSKPPPFPSGGAGLVGTAADYLAFARMLLRGGAPLIGGASVAAMIRDQLTAAQKKVSGLHPGHFDTRGWGYGVEVVTVAGDPAAPLGQYGWNGGLGTVWRNDPSEDLTAILLTNVAWTSSRPPAIARDFLTMAYATLSSE
jgi:CubicO group peptidase (beta-lactamase class C family)